MRGCTVEVRVSISPRTGLSSHTGKNKTWVSGFEDSMSVKLTFESKFNYHVRLEQNPTSDFQYFVENLHV